MISVFWGDNRLDVEKAVRALLGAKYEVLEGENLMLTDLPSIFQGTSLFETGQRKILLKDVGENTAVWEKIADYAGTTHDVVIWETKLDKRTAGNKKLKATGVAMREFPAKKAPEMNLVFGIFETALRDGKKAVQMCEQIELMQDPYMFFGLMVTQALKKFAYRQGRKEKAILQELAELDLKMKTTSVEPWLLVKSFLMNLA